MTKEIKGKKFGRLYLPSYKIEIVRECEQEGSIALVCERHSLSKGTVKPWMRQYSSPSYQQNKGKRRTLSEREGIVREIISGHLSIEEAQLKYDLSCRDTITQWVREYKKRQESLIPPLSEQDPATVDSAGMEIGSLEELKLSQLKIRALEIMLDIASKEFKVDIRKKFGAKQ
ncbi:helix-turn-helix domain-containing protein [Arcticibacter eurypsychrophilus]|uniref:helix-turn-helix domain-containing protein n=1 Tax=Arcticibacter eurypsychrophilus TaxID=1434752 RepID=UPI00084D0294|nr:hypothetical protein [Arcticibacter eurypsychrophilus]